MKATLVGALLLALPNALAESPQKPEQHPYRSRWKKSVVGVGAIGRVTVGAGIRHLRGKPEKYGGGVAGFGKRLGAGLATNAIGKTVETAVAARLHEDLNYHPSKQQGVRPRLLYALKSTVITHNTKNGKSRPAVGRIAGHAASGAFVQGALAAGSGAATGGIGLAANAGMNVFREFVPREKIPLFRRFQSK